MLIDALPPTLAEARGVGSAHAIRGCLLGGAIGDALGLPFEGLSARRIARLAPTARYRFLLGRGMVSDDTEHAIMTAAALAASKADPAEFDAHLARAIRGWFLALPAGIGFATLRACLKLCLGVGPARSGVFSAGNGPCMRAPVLGAAVEVQDRLVELVTRSTRMTHTDPKALSGALAVAAAARLAASGEPIQTRRFLDHYSALARARENDELRPLLDRACASVDRQESIEQFAHDLDLARGVSGYVLHTVPVVIHAWLTHPDDLEAAALAVIRCGGDTDTTAAIVGGIIGARVGPPGLPKELVDGIMLWPWRIGGASEAGRGAPDQPVARQPAWPLAIVRNLAFLTLVLGHGARRLAPPF